VCEPFVPLLHHALWQKGGLYTHKIKLICTHTERALEKHIRVHFERNTPRRAALTRSRERERAACVGIKASARSH